MKKSSCELIATSGKLEAVFVLVNPYWTRKYKSSIGEKGGLRGF
jgi:flagellar assembly factor FliW